MSIPAKYSYDWWQEQPPRPLADIVRQFEKERDTLSPAIRRTLEKHLPPLAEVEAFDRDTARILGL